MNFCLLYGLDARLGPLGGVSQFPCFLHLQNFLHNVLVYFQVLSQSLLICDVNISEERALLFLVLFPDGLGDILDGWERILSAIICVALGCGGGGNAEVEIEVGVHVPPHFFPVHYVTHGVLTLER